MDGKDYSGNWHLSYWYPSNKQPGTEETSEYDVTAEQVGHDLVLQSQPTEDGSYILLKLATDDVYAAGSWTESTAPEGQFGGMIYSGVVQLLITDAGRKMEGIWAGVGRDLQKHRPGVYSGRFELTRL